MSYQVIAAEKAKFPVAMMCELLDVSPSGYYAWCQRPESRRKQRDRELVALVQGVFADSRWSYGSPRITAELRSVGEPVSRKRVARLMREQGLVARRRRRYVHTTNAEQHWKVASNELERQFGVGGERAVWVADITYVATKEGWLYLAVVLDLRSRRVVGWAMGDKLETKLPLGALEMAVARRGAAAMHHSDRGAQYTSEDYLAALARHGIACSMSRAGNCWDNAVAESFFATLKTECVGASVYQTRQQARAELFDYIECFYNRTRRHSALGYRSPADFEREVMNAA